LDYFYLGVETKRRHRLSNEFDGGTVIRTAFKIEHLDTHRLSPLAERR
jgi:hypothetical protein